MASLLSRNVSYEGPALRKQLAKAQQLQQELSRREVECLSSAADLRERYYAACKQYGITVRARVQIHTIAREQYITTLRLCNTFRIMYFV